jgi:hypothetical protein
MSSLRIDLQAGFQGEPVAVSVDGREVFRKDDVRTDYSVGLADTLTVDVPGAEARVEVALERRGVRGAFQVAAGEGTHVGVNVSPEGEVTHTARAAGFEYF